MKSWEQCAMKSWEQYSPDWIKLEPKSANDKGKAHGYYRGVGNTVDVLWGVEGEAAAPNYHDICLEQGLAIDMDKMPHIVDMVVKEYEVDRLINHSLYEKLAAFFTKKKLLKTARVLVWYCNGDHPDQILNPVLIRSTYRMTIAVNPFKEEK
jgi:hypothetical protein